MTKFSVFGILLLCFATLAVAQDTHNAGGQAGSVVDDVATPTTAPPSNIDHPVDPAAPAAPAAPPSAPQTTAMAPWVNPGAAPAAVPAPMSPGSTSSMANSGSGSFGSGADIESPVPKKSKKITATPTPAPSEDSGVPVLSMTCAWTIVALAGLAAML